MKAEDVLKLPMQRNDACAGNIGEYLFALLAEVLNKGEGFSAKRPFGNSGWYSDLKLALVKGGAVNGEIIREYYDDGEFEDYVKIANADECNMVLCESIHAVLT